MKFAARVFTVIVTLALTSALAAVLVLVLAPSAKAQTWKVVNCLPSSWFPKGEGTAAVIYETATVRGRMGWCKTDQVMPAGQSAWVPWAYQYCIKSKCNSVPSNFDFFSLVDTIRSAPDPVAAASSAAAQLRIAPTAAEKVDIDIWWVRACTYITTPPYPVQPPGGWSPGYFFPGDYCGTEPTPAPPPTTQYVVTGLVAYPLTATGTKSNIAWPEKPISGEPCDASFYVTSFNVKFYRIPRLSTTQTVVAGCGVKK